MCFHVVSCTLSRERIRIFDRVEHVGVIYEQHCEQGTNYRKSKLQINTHTHLTSTEWFQLRSLGGGPKHCPVLCHTFLSGRPTSTFEVKCIVTVTLKYVFIYLTTLARSSVYIASNCARWIPKDVKRSSLWFWVTISGFTWKVSEENYGEPQDSLCPHRNSNRTSPEHKTVDRLA